MGRKKVCLICKQDINSNEKFVPYKKRYAHEHCFNSLMSLAVKSKPKDTSKTTTGKRKKQTKMIDKPVSEEEKKEKDELFNFLKKFLNTDKLDVSVYTLIKKYKTDYPYFTYTGMLATLKYYYIDMEHSVKEGSSVVGIIPYVYDKAQDYYNGINKARDYNKKNISAATITQRVIRIKPPKNKIKLIDISKIGE